MGKLVVGLSGGVDSSVAAALLVEAGHEVVGITLRTAPWAEAREETARFGSCCSPETASGARAVARQLGIPYYLLNHEREFADLVIADFTREYAAGRTPSPCVVCNREVKFGTLLRRALAWEAEAVATGHYARLARDPASGRLLLLRAVDGAKDQSYFLWPLTQGQLERARFPIGDLSKAAVRAKARALGLATAETPESQELCFIEGDYRAFLRERAPAAFRPGPILDEAGDEVGQHAGLGAYTIGQRRGLGIATADGVPRYVVALDPVRNAVVVGRRERLDAAGLVARDVNWIACASLDEPLDVEARIRHNGPLVPARIVPRGPGEVDVRFAVPQRAVTAGQSVVFYRREMVVGGGIIARAA
ncbi:MAG TPA: tRNA 2-thiouridine(34) synthase MnmA [Methylomirabilota bacterium]|jgi:tRNA-specific 2-thiouridylase|nr:tRNA 2-thiouridine(34) synthase MnmA [Methylomirabilota bacterium]